jgi:DNA-directed RNA polymerase specialized sigma24 family protein
MSEATEDVEGQAIARAVLDALDRDQAPDWEALDRAYHGQLLSQARACVRRRGLQGQLTEEDLLHDFLVKRVYPPKRARQMFGPTARGDRPLCPRLLASLGNHCVDLARTLGRRPDRGGQPEAAANQAAPEEAPLPPFEDLVDLLHRQNAAVRAACGLRRRPHGAAYREALLVRLRLDWAGAFDGVELQSQETGRPVLLTLPLLEELTSWTDQERAVLLVEGGAALEQLWERLRELLLQTPGRVVSTERLAALVPVSADLWDQWVSRGRRRLRTSLGDEEYGQVFAMWDNRGEGP